MSPILERIQVLMQENNDSPTAIFEKIGIRKNALSEWKRVKVVPRLMQLLKLPNIIM